MTTIILMIFGKLRLDFSFIYWLILKLQEIMEVAH